MDESVKKESLRLYDKFGRFSEEVVKEIKKYDYNDYYFWNCVIIELRNLNK